jgi:hypothetical protein
MFPESWEQPARILRAGLGIRHHADGIAATYFHMETQLGAIGVQGPLRVRRRCRRWSSNSFFETFLI